MTIWPAGNVSSRTYNAFIADISDRVQSEKNIRLLHAELVANSLQLEQSNQGLKLSSYSISHDLRAPLRHIDGYARMLHEDAADTLTGEPRRYLDESANPRGVWEHSSTTCWTFQDWDENPGNEAK
ncbi:MAG: hypothetical protein IPH43_06525 [Xanthomonadales bacterium]|nr:hypothetical protein [Xanthomonadales bacterium]